MSSKLATRYPIFSLAIQRIEQIIALVETDIRKLRHDPYELFTRMIQPAVWLLIFGQAMAKIKVIPVGSLSYVDYLAPGILAQSVLILGIFYGISIIWERDMGVLHKILVTPTPRSILVLGRALSAGIRGLPQIFMIYLLAILLGVNIRWELLPFLGVIVTVLLGGAAFSTFSLIIACYVKKRERFMGIGQIMIMPTFFASNALYPIEMMPRWLQVISKINPLTYQVDALRNFMVTDAVSTFGLFIDFAVILVTFFIVVAIATKTYPKILY